jgi:hypothetical protein
MGQHLTTLCSHVPVVLYHSKEVSQLLYIVRWVERKYCLHLFQLGFDSLSGQYVTKIFDLMTLSPVSHKLVSTVFIFKR